MHTDLEIEAMYDIKLLQSWFEEAKEGVNISNHELDAAISQMMRYAVKDGLDPDSPDCKAEYRKMRKQVRAYNDSLDANL